MERGLCGYGARAGGHPPMKKKHVYRATAIENVRMSEVLPALLAGCIVAVDVAKKKFLVALANAAGETRKLFRFEHPRQTRKFLELVLELKRQLGTAVLRVAMEPTGTYGDAIRSQLSRQGVPVMMVQPKKTHDSQEIFDGVPSLHDEKSAVLLAKLCAVTETKEWKEPEEKAARLRALVEERRHHGAQEEACLGRLEALLARHWPELGEELNPRLTSAIALLEQYPSPTRVKAEADGARELLRKVSRQKLKPEKIEAVVQGASESLGQPATSEEEHYVQTLAQDVQRARRGQAELEAQMEAAATGYEVFDRLRRWMGTYTAAVLVALCDPTKYAHVDEFVKACGLNLKVRSSGNYAGQLKLTKRGPGVVRQLLFLFTLRMLNENVQVEAWYKAHVKCDELKMKAVIATMRKLAAAVFHVARGKSFEPERLFNLKSKQITKALARPARQPQSAPYGQACESEEDLPWSKYLPAAGPPATAA